MLIFSSLFTSFLVNLLSSFPFITDTLTTVYLFTACVFMSQSKPASCVLCFHNLVISCYCLAKPFTSFLCITDTYSSLLLYELYIHVVHKVFSISGHLFHFFKKTSVYSSVYSLFSPCF